ncbi:unnamed protein product [Oppiella nova]|uniref:Uncharacterized protein n=1 Tax=Oppiella nova TaxID=334625 RepID=A0A7R9R3B2_9ACAR|nr:unnamed protein product [Oppiella nova]CAG2184103.1 unnamed protein product [Oppiella nova]
MDFAKRRCIERHVKSDPYSAENTGKSANVSLKAKGLRNLQMYG